MLGKTLNDPLGIESAAGNTQGFGLLDMHTEFKPGKHLKQRSGHLVSLTDATQTDTPVKGYEIHCGETSGPALNNPLWSLIKNNDTQNPEHTSTEFEGIQTPDNQIRGTYLHGLFDQPETLSAMLDWAGLDNESQTLDLNVEREKNLERLAKTLEEHLDIERILGFMA
jgi:adenosylcobyric acid synthase